MNTKRLLPAEGVSTAHKRHKGRGFGGKGLEDGREETLHLKLFLRHLCPQCSETDVADEVRNLRHVQRVQPHPERHEIEIWAGFPAEGLFREIVDVVRSFCCDVAASHAR